MAAEASPDTVMIITIGFYCLGDPITKYTLWARHIYKIFIYKINYVAINVRKLDTRKLDITQSSFRQKIDSFCPVCPYVRQMFFGDLKVTEIRTSLVFGHQLYIFVLPISDGVGADRTWLIRIMVRLMVMRRPSKLAMLFWFIRRKYLWYRTSTWTSRNRWDLKSKTKFRF